jgi:type I restriction-modification system DNA methylase subunit
MANERVTENLTLKEMKCEIGKNSFGYVYSQGDASNIDKVDALLKRAGGKPAECELNDFAKGGSGKGTPEFVITFNDDTNTLLVVECKKSVKEHISNTLTFPKKYAVDGVLYYAKFLKEDFNIIAVAISGTKLSDIKVDAFYWRKSADTYETLNKAKDIILEPKNYLKLIKGQKLQKDYSLDEIRELAIDMHNSLREIAVREEHKPIFIAGVLIALNNEDFSNSYSTLSSYNLLMSNIQTAIENELKKGGIRNDRSEYIHSIFRVLHDNQKFSEIPLAEKTSIRWYVEQLEMKIKPMMDYADSTLDALGVFYHEFIKYSGGDGSGLGIVLTPQHLTDFMCELAGVNKNSKVVDICCGSGGFLVTAMSKMFKNANPIEIEQIRKERLYGVEQDDGLYTLAIANMIIRQDGKSNIYKDDCFNPVIAKTLKALSINIGLINPPYSLKGKKSKVELEFVEQLLSILTPGGVGVVVVPVSCAIGTKFKDVRERLFKHHTLKAVFTMPDDIFYPTGTNPCVMVWEAHTPHNSMRETFFGYCKNDGFVKRKKLGRIDYYNRWQDKTDKNGKVIYQGILSQWLKLYHNRIVKDGLSAMQCVTYKDEWLCEAYMNTDYTLLTQDDFQSTINDYLAYLVKAGEVNESQ